MRWKRRNQTNSQCCGGQWQGATDNRKSRAETSEKMNEAEAKRVLFRKRQKERQAKNGEQKDTTTKIDLIFARIEANGKSNGN